jgi:hypothetical protein
MGEFPDHDIPLRLYLEPAPRLTQSLQRIGFAAAFVAAAASWGGTPFAATEGEQQETRSDLMNDGARKVVEKAAALLARSALTGAELAERGGINGALPVLAPDGDLRSWIAPVVVDDLIVGYFWTDPSRSDWRYESFQRRPETFDGCPAASLWLDTADIARRAGGLALPGERASPPVLSFDGVPDRIAWAVTLTAPDGRTRRILVAGRAVWEAVADH